MLLFPFAYRLAFILFFSVTNIFGLDVSKACEKIAPVIEQTVKNWDIPGLAVGIVYKGEVVFEKTYGVQKKGENNPITSETIFPIHSLTKNFTATLLVLLHQEGIVDLYAPIDQYIPELKLSDLQKSSKLTILDVLSQRSGLPGFCFDSLWALGFSELEMIKKFPLIPLRVPFEQEYTYQNVLFGCLRLVIEKVTQKPYEVVLHEKLLKPLGLKNSYPGYDFWASAAKVGSWWQKFLQKTSLSKSNAVFAHDSIWNPTTQRFDSHLMPKGPLTYAQLATSGMNSTLKDMITWMSFQLAPSAILKQESLNLMQTPHSVVVLKNDTKQFPQDRFTNTSYGIGWFVSTYGVGQHSIKLLSHMGGLTGGRTLITIAPDQEIGIVLLCNMGGMRANLGLEEIRNTFFDFLLNLPFVNWNERIQQDILKNRRQFYHRRQEQRLMNPTKHFPLKFYEGTYVNALYGTVTLKEQEGKLTAHHEKGSNFVLQHWNGSVFCYKGSDISPNLGSNDEGEAWFYGNGSRAQSVQFTLLYEGVNPIFERKS